VGILENVFDTGDTYGLVMIILAIAVGVGIFVVLYGLLSPSRGRPREKVVIVNAKQMGSLQLRLDKAQIDVPASEFIKRSLTYGIPVGLALFLLIGSVVLIGVGIFAGFMITWTNLEQERDRKMIRYTKQLASACDTVRTAYGVNPSLKKALEAVAEYGQSPVKEDFHEILVAASQEQLVEGLNAVAERRASIVFDTIATSLIRANEATGEVNDMLTRLADSTRQNTAAFEEAITSQLNARSTIQWGTYGPWLIFCMFRVMTLLMSASAGQIFGAMNSFYATIPGNIVALAAALISIFVYRNATQISQRGLVVTRVAATAPVIISGQKPLQGQTYGSTLSAQSRSGN
jgi:hypothetical protein